MDSLIQTFHERKGDLLQAFIEHIQLSFIALFFAVLIAVPLGIWLTRHKKTAESIIGVTAVLQTIPSLALLGLMIPLFGIGKVPAVIALVAYALLPILRNTYTGITGVDEAVIESAQAMGMNGRQLFTKVELPLAMPVMMAGIRTAMVLIVGTATLAALIGAGGLGDVILLGIDRNNAPLIIIGAIPTALLAIFFDVLLRMAEKLSFRRSVILSGTALAVLFALTFVPALLEKEEESLVIAGKMGAEPEILMNMYKLLIEEKTDLDVELKPGLGKTSFVFNALRSEEIDLYPEFTGTAISEFLKEEAVSADREDVYEQARKGLLEEYDLVMLEPMAYNNTYALAVPETFAEEHDVRSISDLARVEEDIRAGFTLEFSDREDGYLGIQKLYGLRFPSVQTMEPKLRYQAVASGDINLVDAYSTDSELERFHLTVLEDDRHLFPPYQGAPLLRRETLEQYPELEPVLNQLAGKVTDEEMRGMNYEVSVEGKKAEEVASAFLKEQGLLP
ncbi:ABC transporter permease/substrate-binding protein [Bacillus thermotolerans]|uniref:Probable ergothioneine transporter EgtUBC n=1 Tax=Bacillus thermotolerans TaxID=1221996 RepID=A0A0F5HUD7_BACTR|nr:ABC transporter permease/substrate-binding protein [Bacillus thermotolerans]KKB36863.1 L-proline glycine betaine binding ABC transporter protein ProX [Bacillus thermotolerans]